MSRKELARELRKAAYQRAKQARAADPRHQAMKEAAKQRRREMYQQVKERRKAREAELEARAKASAAAEREAMQRQLAERVRGAIQGRAGRPDRAHLAGALLEVGGAPAAKESPERTLARDIERALQCSDVRDLLDRLRRESASLATQHGDATLHSGDDSPETCSPET